MERKPFENQQSDVVSSLGISALPFYGLARGFLSGKYRPGVSVESVRAASVEEYQTEKGWKIVQTLDEIATSHNASLSSVALGWLRSNSAVSTPIASARTVEQLMEFINVIVLTHEEVASLNSVSA
jgi:aryl-alcohol dehydrogenase-like predicted oxidoreductase